MTPVSTGLNPRKLSGYRGQLCPSLESSSNSVCSAILPNHPKAFLVTLFSSSFDIDALVFRVHRALSGLVSICACQVSVAGGFFPQLLPKLLFPKRQDSFPAAVPLAC